MANTKMGIRNNIKDAFVAQFTAAFENAVQIDDYTYVIQMGTVPETGMPLYAKIDVSCPNWYATVKTKPFNLEAKVAEYRVTLEARAREAVKKAEESAAKDSKRKSKKDAE